MNLLKTAIVGGIVVCAAPVLAQNLTKGEVGGKAVGQCYTTCTERALDRSDETFDYWDRSAAWLSSDDFFNANNSTVSGLLDNSARHFCRKLINDLVDMTTCALRCRDVESAYRVISSQARSNFLERIDYRRDRLIRWRLWEGDSFVSGEAFDNACYALTGRRSGTTAAEAKTRTAQPLYELHAPPAQIQ